MRRTLHAAAVASVASSAASRLSRSKPRRNRPALSAADALCRASMSVSSSRWSLRSALDTRLLGTASERASTRSRRRSISGSSASLDAASEASVWRRSRTDSAARYARRASPAVWTGRSRSTSGWRSANASGDSSGAAWQTFAVAAAPSTRAETREVILRLSILPRRSEAGMPRQSPWRDSYLRSWAAMRRAVSARVGSPVVMARAARLAEPDAEAETDAALSRDTREVRVTELPVLAQRVRPGLEMGATNEHVAMASCRSKR